MQLLLSPSMMCANFQNLNEEMEMLNRADINMYHMDIMDGLYVPNFALGLEDYETMRQNTNKTMDAHLMIESPHRYIKLFSDLGADIIYFCPDAEQQPVRTIEEIHDLGKKAGISVNTNLSFEMVKELLPIVDYVLIMTVNPGFAGQKFQNFVLKKLDKFILAKSDYHYILGVDGAISREKIKCLYKKGVDNFILGTSALFNKSQNYQKTIELIRKEND
ncbi:ribulose-phosphate 3-epimerase [uncultured Lactobacillus sp.]|uniref:ribulose-phosphate 3-epimerase n=1 Tax=uncultured Lactobacillus sp. TaxID=153152 RepID=UPI0025F8BE8A|nr:ribulose-phosphate 3-epimerase [uncultured Lactobacillus sp.]MCT6890612.1 ribulose-phosphate 3-epimerase [Lactobacillus sp.]